ncbi:PhoX family phosphatase [Alkalinema sp. FACHB-956]|uniref:PhoX family protein n=1 Tax=Alkalinema sp. FACHB-956 TaxID=2692768 RepID=UPI001682DCE7|nr:PhoX family phosphatase [Alkalinema sp. FACHB-956]MBD2326450.1 PhoX family phosphatase [Alkalinema sp. FACHB-956]
MVQNIDDNQISNHSSNRTFEDVLRVGMSRRHLLARSAALSATGFLASMVSHNGNGWGTLTAMAQAKPATRPTINFQPVLAKDGSGPVPNISADYQYDVLIPWGTPLKDGVPEYDGNPVTRPTAAQQAQQIGIGHDGMWLFPLGNGNTSGVLAINHEFGGNTHILGKANPASLEDVRLSQHAHGVSVVELKKQNGKWDVVRNSKKNRRIHVNTPVKFTGPVANSDLLKTPAGNAPLGTLNNCANGKTPWGTYLTCEENFNGYFGDKAGTWTATPEQARYGFSKAGFGYGWEKFDDRFDLSNPRYKNEENTYGWVVEIDPMDASQTPVKRTALGRFKHENAELVVGRGGRAVVYMGDDERFDYIYKFVSEANWRSMQARGISPLDRGKLYVAKFNDDFTGEWLELSINNPKLKARFKTQAEVLTYARIAGDLLGATKMDRPEWISTAPNGDVYCTLTNNSRRTAAQVDKANPLGPNPDGHIIKWRDADNHVGLTFKWDIYVLSQDTHGTTDERTFSSPDGLWADPDGRLFIQTDGGQKKGLNDQMLVADPNNNQIIRRLFTGVTDCEVTGLAVTPDRRTMFVNLQHPGDGDPTKTNFPAAQGSGKVPRDATIVITRKDGGIIGS